MEKLLMIEEVAARLSLGPASVRRLIASGELATVRPTGARAVRIRERDLDKFINTLRAGADAVRR